MPGKHHLRGFKIAQKIGSPLRGSWTMVSIALVDARKTSLTGVQNSKKIGSPLRGSWTMVSIALVDARKTSLMGVQNSKKIGSPLRGSWTVLRIVVGTNPPLGKKLDPPLVCEQCCAPPLLCLLRTTVRHSAHGATCIMNDIQSPAPKDDS